MASTEQEIKSILKEMDEFIFLGVKDEYEAFTDAMDLIKQEVGYENN